MPSVIDSGIFGSWQTGSVVPDPLLSIQEQSPAVLLPPTTLSCLFTHQPPVVSVRVYVYHNYRALQPPPRRPCSPAPPPLPSMLSILTWHDFLSPPFLLPGSERDRITHSAPPSPLSSTVAPLAQSWAQFTVSALPSTTLQFRLLLTPSCKEYFTPSLFVCDYLPW